MTERLFREPSRDELMRLQLSAAEAHDYASYCGAEDPKIREVAFLDANFLVGVIDGIGLKLNPATGRESITVALADFSTEAKEIGKHVDRVIKDQEAYLRGLIVASEVVSGKTFLPDSMSDLFEAKRISILSERLDKRED